MLESALENDQLVIRVGVSALAVAIKGGDAYANEDFEITDEAGFAQDVLVALESEENCSGDTLVHAMLDAAANLAVENGSDHCSLDGESQNRIKLNPGSGRGQSMKTKTDSPARDVGCSAGLGCDRIAEARCAMRIPTLRALGLKHLRETTAEAASLEIQRRDFVLEIEWCPEHYGRDLPFGHWHCTITRSRKPRGLVIAQGHGETIRGAIVMALTDLEWEEAKHPNPVCNQAGEKDSE